MLKTNLPVLIVRNIVLFPYTECKFEFDNINDKKIISLADNYFDGHLLVVIANDENYNKDNLSKIGIVGQIKFKIDMPNGMMKVSIRGINRVNICEYHVDNNLYEASVVAINNKNSSPVSELASARTLKKIFNNYVETKKGVGNSIIAQIEEINTVSKLTDIIISFVPMAYIRKVKYIDEIDSIRRVEMLIDDLNYELKLLEYEQGLDDKVNQKLEMNQREFLLKEKLKVINEELGLSEANTYDELINKLEKFKCPVNIKKRLSDEIERYKLCNSNSPEIGIIKNYIDTLFSLPWEISTKDNTDVSEISRKLESSHYGLEETKIRILEYIATREHTHNHNSPVICLVGPPGVGKTSIARAIGEALNRKCVKISVGGINDEAEITGHRRAYVGAAPGKIIAGLKKAKVNNPVFIIDEIDKMTKDIKGDPASSLLEVLDKEQNDKFVDHFVEEEFDLSKVMFILTANYIDKIPNELKDRLEIIELSSYTIPEKLTIVKDYIIPKLKIEYEFNEITIKDDSILEIIKHYTKESGVRELERLLRKIFRKTIYNRLTNKNDIDINNSIEKLLGHKKYEYLDNYDNVIGTINGLSYTPYGGEIVKVETVLYKGNGRIKLTGLLGEMMSESISIAFDYVKSHSNEYEIDYQMLNKNDFHVHLPSGAIKKDGPSAGVTVVTSILSLLKKVNIDKSISMTGEITLSGRILPVGGLKEKIIVAEKNGIKKIYIPKSNEKEVLEYEKLYKDILDIKFVDYYNEIYNDLFYK